MARERVLITVKTYPTLSSKYDEVVCTAGIREDGSWIRIYPVPFRKLDDFERYSKFDWVEIDLERNQSDPRHESYRPKSEIAITGHMDCDNDWWERRQLILEKGTVYTSFDEIIDRNKDNHALSLATFKPTEITGFHIEPEKSPNWDEKKLEQVKLRANQTDLFQDTHKTFKVVNKLPYKFRYSFKDDSGRERNMMISDWELGALYWRQLRKHNGDTDRALKDVKNKYMNDLVKDRDIHLFVGTNQSWDMKLAPNPFLIIGVFSPPMVLQDELF